MRSVVRSAALAGAMGLLGVAGCLVPDEGEYCAFRYGDDSCGRDFCVLAKEKASHEGIVDGCSKEEAPDGFVRVAYGLPVMVLAPEGRPEDPRSVQGVLARRGGYEGCGTVEDLEARFGPVLGGVAAIRRRLEEPGRVRRKTLELDGDDEAALVDFGEAMAMWMNECDAGATGTGTSGSTGSSGEVQSESATSSTTDDEPCTTPEDCGGVTPFCDPVGMVCVACDGMPDPDGACAEVDPEAAACVNGTCGECSEVNASACTTVPPECDLLTNTCVPCTAHDQCGDAACNLFTGACLPGNAVVHVGPGERFTTLGAAVASFSAGEEGTIIVHVPMSSYNESVVVDGGRVLAFLAAELGPGVEPPWWVRTSGNTPQLIVSDGTVLMDGMRLSNNASGSYPGLRVDAPGRAWVDRSRIVNNNGGGIVANDGAELVLRNCFVGGDINDENALEVNAGAAVSVLYTTLASGFGAARVLMCSGVTDVSVRNSLLVMRDTAAEVTCPGVTIEHSAAELDLGGTNTALGDMSTNWFTSYNGGDLHLALPHPAAISTAAQWRLGDPPTDIDGEPRPTDDLSSDYAGADVP